MNRKPRTSPYLARGPPQSGSEHDSHPRGRKEASSEDTLQARWLDGDVHAPTSRRSWDGTGGVTHQVVKDTATIPFTNPCAGETGTATITFRGVFEQTDRPVDTYNLLNNITG